MRTLSRALAVVACAALLFCAGMILVEIFLRSVFSTSTFIGPELVGYAVAIATFFALPSTFRQGEHIRAGLLVERLAGRARQAAEFTCGLAAFAFASFACWYLFGTLLRHLNRGTVADSGSGVLLWWPYAGLVIGMAVLTLEILMYLVRVLIGASPMKDGASIDSYVHDASNPQ